MYSETPVSIKVKSAKGIDQSASSIRPVFSRRIRLRKLPIWGYPQASTKLRNRSDRSRESGMPGRHRRAAAVFSVAFTNNPAAATRMRPPLRSGGRRVLCVHSAKCSSSDLVAGPISVRCRRRLLSPIFGDLSPFGDKSASGDASYTPHPQKLIGRGPGRERFPSGSIRTYHNLVCVELPVRSGTKRAKPWSGQPSSG
jgi:hypothetical protein